MATTPISATAFLWPTMLLALLLALPGADAVAAPGAAAGRDDILAEMADAGIAHEEYEAAVAAAARSKFYHGKPQPGELLQLRREVADRLATEALLLREAKRRGLKPDAEAVRKTLRTYEQRLANSEQWQNNRDRLLPGLAGHLERASLLEQLESAVRDVPAPDEGQIREYYLAHPEKFTEPEQFRVALILLKVDPSAPETRWQAAEQEAAEIVGRWRAGEDFGALARAHSAGPSAERGGDMGYLHRGMLPDAAQDLLESVAPGEVAPPLRLLEGVAVLRLLERKAPRLNSLETVHERARDLLKRDREDAAWNSLISGLRQ